MAGTQFDPVGVEAFLAEIDVPRAAAAGGGGQIDPPLEAVADRVRTLLTQAAA
jgi:hypothetical protein